MFWVRIILHFAFSLIVVSMFSMESSVPGSLPSISSIVVMLASNVPYFFPRVSIYRVVSLWVFFIVSTSLFRSWMVLFSSISCLALFSCNSLRHFCVSSLKASRYLPVFYFISFLKSSIIIIRSDFISMSCFSGVMVNPGLATVGEFGSDDAK